MQKVEDQRWECWRVGDEGWECWRVRDQDCRHRDLGCTGPFLPDPAGFGCLTQTHRFVVHSSFSHLSSISCCLFETLESQFASATVKKKKKCINGKLCAHQSPNFSWFLVFSSINPKCAFHFIFPPFEDICLAFALWDWEGGQGH